MTPTERRASQGLAFIFALRMLGLFLVLPVFALEAQKYPGGDNPALVGVAMGLYGLTQAVLQLPFGMASDRFGRKRVIVIGLLVFVLGSLVAAWATSLQGLALGRALQGAGAVSAAVTALLADLTRDQVRTKGMALIGMSIGLMFAVALVLAPWLTALVGLPGLFYVTAALALGGIAAVCWWVPAEPARHGHAAGTRTRFADVLADGQLLRLNVGVFVLHAVQMAMWVALPAWLVQAGLARADHWQVYLPAVVLSFLVMGALLFPLERRGRLRLALRGAVALLALVQAGFLVVAHLEQNSLSLAPLVWLLLLFFCAFNGLEASLPSLVSRLAPATARGAALGVYNTCQSLGLFAGGALGGLLIKQAGPQGLFLATVLLSGVWLALMWGVKAGAQTSAHPSAAQ
jgi:MFS family permease